MAVIVIVHRRREVAAQYALWLDGRGHAFFTCGGPIPPGYACPVLRDESCALWEAGQLFIYDPWLDSPREEANSEKLVMALRQRYPKKPLILVGSSPITPTWVERLAKRDLMVKGVFPEEPQTLQAAVDALLLSAETCAVSNDAMAGYGIDPRIEAALLAQEGVARRRSLGA